MELRELMGVTSGREPRRSLPGTGLAARGLWMGDPLCEEKVLALCAEGRWAEEEQRQGSCLSR